MSGSTLLMLICFMLGGMAWYSQYRLRNMIYCTFHRANKTRIEKFVRERARIVTFDGGEYVVDTSKVSLTYYNRGINQLFPTFVPTLDYYYGSPYPLDPDMGKPSWYTAEAQKALTQEKNIRDLDRATQAQAGQKVSGFTKYLPWITLALLAVALIWIYQMSGNVAMLTQLSQVK